ncbi:helicase-related protein [Stomatobaculum longum]|uniref:helicase-related protein n=1 Tax=Stomatobaculum longum TaxID=796942 RepID=UPI002804A964|nr:helicase-related protein [Stomatobaculum longum]
MDNDQIVSRMNSYLHTSANALAEWLGSLLPRASDDWWEECVLDKLSYNQREMAIERGFTELGQFDLAALLRIADKSWYAMRNVAFLPTRERECIRDMMRVRNNWAHVSAMLPGKDAILADLTTLHDFFEQRGCEDSLLNEIDRMIEEVKSPSTVDFASFSQGVETEQTAEAEPEVVDENEITEKSLVYLIGNPDVRGIVMSITNLGETKKYDVFVDGKFKTFYSGQIALYVETASYNWVDINTFRSYLTAYQINNPSGNNLYSLNSARIDFVPYQFRPALKLIHADEPRILIADSVGVGKTIEAGLIIKELQARNELENVLIICPKPLVTERKWEMEMKRFDEEFVPVDGPMLRQIISDTDRDGEWPIRFSKTIIPYSILDSRAYEGETTKKKHTFGLRDLDPAPHFDLVIIDEAHHIRKGSMEKEKAFEYKCVKYFCDNADAVVMLTATPLQTSDDDLFTLLNVLRPDIVIDKQTFNMMSRPNAHISEAASLMRRADEKWQELASEALKGVLDTQWGENVIAANPTYGEMVKTLQQDKITREERVKLISDAESLHSFNSMLNRTRRKDIQDFCIRRPFTLAVEFTERQKELHDELLRFETDALLQLHGKARSIPFMMSTIKRQAASCIFGLAPHIRDLIQRRFQQMEDDLNLDYSPVFAFDGADASALARMAQNLLTMADNLPEEDPKFDQMLEAIMEKQKQDNNKIILFSTFRYTLYYLKKKLLDAGLRVEQVDGSVKDAMRQEYRARFELPKDDKDAIDILLFTEVGSEGLDYQFCDTMINYDLPWNPMRIEQRIGRIDRRGQQSEAVGIYNMITNGTVDADIYYRCLMRIGIFESSIGGCDEILGNIATQLDHIGMDTSLTDEERKIKLEQMADNEIRRLQELNKLEEEEKEFFGFDLSEYMTSQEIHNAENPWLTQKSLQILIEQYLFRRLGKGSYILGESEVKQLRLSATARAELRDDFRKLPSGRNAVRQSWDVYLKGKAPIHPITFDSETAEKKRDTFFITAMHPLAKQAAAYFASNEQAYIRLQYATEDLPSGSYHFSVYAWSYVGINPHFKLVVVCDDDVIAAELPDILQESQSGAAAVKMRPSDWDALEKKQVRLWMDEKAAEINGAANTSTFKIESLSNNFRNRKRSLEQKILDTSSESIRRMYTSELESATEGYELKVEEIKKKVVQTDIHTTLIANGILDVVN